MEEGKNEPRILVSLCPYDRVLTTALIYELIENMGQRFHSYSYNLNYFYDAGSVFMPWYDSWKRFQQDVENYLFLDFFSENGIIKLDLTKFYDSIYIHALFRQIQEQGNQTENEEKKKRIDAILRYLGNYTEKLMLQMKGNIRGVPQGPAYARVFAELFLTAVLDSFCRKYHYTTETCRIMRYVDDMFIVYRGIDGNQLLNRFSEYIFARGLEINRSKTLIYECIGDMSEREKESLFENGAANYEMKSIQGMELEDEELQQENIRLFEKYLHRKGSWSIKDANFILNRYLDPIFVDEYLNKYAITLVKQKVGRGSIYKRLYEELFKRDEWLEKFFAMELYRQIPQNTVNFKNFMSVCYFSEERLAWYIVVKLAPDEETITLEEVFLKGTQNEKLTLLKLMEEEASYNLFSAPYIVRNSKDHRVLRLLNPAASHDKAIVCNDTKEENEKDGFLKMLRMGIQNLRGCWLFKDDCDVLTVGFKDCVEKIQQAYSVNIVIHNEISSDFCSDKTTNDLVEKLYGESKPEGICCVFRYNNQPFKMVFPDYVCECNKRTGLFYRHNEEK